jgi:hypothetical protein
VPYAKPTKVADAVIKAGIDIGTILVRTHPQSGRLDGCEQPKGCQVNLRGPPLSEDVSAVIEVSSNPESSGGLHLVLQGKRLRLQYIG